MEPTEVVLRFLESVGRRSDAEFYLSVFRAEAKESFATLSIDGPVVRGALDAVTLDLRFLTALGLTPVVVVGLFNGTEAAKQASLLAHGLVRSDVSAQTLSPSEDLVAQAAAAARQGIIPIIPFGPSLGEALTERFEKLDALVMGLKTRKLIFMRRRGGLRIHRKLVSVVNLTTEADLLLSSKEISRVLWSILTESRRLVCEKASHKITVAVTSPLELLRELFTVKGAGTLLRRGARVNKVAGYEGVDRVRLNALLDSAFGRSIDLTFFEKPVSRVYVDDDYRGVAIVNDTPLGAYLSKFAVDRVAQGEGIGRDVWEKMISDTPKVFWRSRPDNPINPWYLQECGGFIRFPEWHIFWKGFAPDRIPEAIAYALAQPQDFPKLPPPPRANGAV